MTPTLHKRYVRSITWLLVAYLATIALITVLYQVSDLHGEGGSLWHEIVETLVLLLAGLLALPPMLLAVRWTCHRMLRPLKSFRETAERIIAGQLHERIVTENPGDDLGRLAATINDAFDRYREAMDRQQRFASDASHQLRTPLTAIRTTGEICLQKARAPEEYREAIGSMLEDVHRLSDMVEKLLLLARLGEDQVRATFAPVDLGATVRNVLAQYDSLVVAKEIRLRVTARRDIRVSGDEALLEQMFANLADNAMRYTPEGGVLVVEVDAPDARHAVLLIRDSGPGISPQLHDLLFQRFARGPSADTGGTGLGLAIVADIVNLHRGRIELLGGPGACFRVTLPRLP